MTRGWPLVGLAACLAACLVVSGTEASQPRATDPDGTTPLHWAVRAGDRAGVRRLLRAGADVSAANRYGVTPLALAAEAGDGAMVETLVAAGASARSALPRGRTVLMLAARAGSARAIETLVRHGADVNAREDVLGETALIWAAAEDHGDAVRLLVAAGAHVDARSKTLSYPESEWGDGKSGRFTVLPRGGWTALMYAARQDARGAIQALAAAHAALDATDPDGTTPLILALINAHYAAASLLLELGADPNVADSRGMTPLYAAVDMHTLDETPGRPAPSVTEADSLDVAARLLAKGADPNPRLTATVLPRVHNNGDPVLGEGATPLMRAMRKGDVTAARLLLRHGADPRLAMKGGVTAVMVASGFGGQVRFAEYNPRSGTEADAIECVRLALDAGAAIDATTDGGQTALHVAAAQRGPAFIRFLVARGASLAARDEVGATALDVALGQGGGRGRRPAVARPEVALVLRDLSTPAAK